MNAKVIERFANGAHKVEFAAGVQVGIAHDGRVYWATPEGWEYVLDHPEIFREGGYRILGDQTGWPTTHGSEFYV